MKNLESLVGKIVVEIKGNRFDEEFVLITQCGLVYTFHHEQSCCEYVYLEDVIGDNDDLLGEIILAEEATNRDISAPTHAKYIDPMYIESYTWTFYRFATKKGLVVLRFFGSSNGYYSEEVSLTITELEK